MKALSGAANHSMLWFARRRRCWPLRRGHHAQGRGAGRARRSRWPARWRTPCSSRCCRAAARPRPSCPPTRRIADPPTSSSFPSGHAASAAAFATAVAMESPRLGARRGPAGRRGGLLAGPRRRALDLGRRGGAAVGAGVALATRALVAGARAATRRGPARWTRVPELPDGEGLVMMVQPALRRPGTTTRPTSSRRRCRAAIVVRADPDRGIDEQLDEAVVHAAATRRVAVGVAGGDGTVAAPRPRWPERRGLPLVVVPTGTLNHFARDVGVYDLQEAMDATGAGQAVAVDLALVDVHPGRGDDPEVARGDAPADLPQHREHRLVPRPRAAARAVAAAVGQVARVRRGARGGAAARREPVRVKIDGRWRAVWFLFVGNGPYAPARAWCPRGGRRWTPGCSTCAGCAPTSASPGCAPWWACSPARSGTAGCTASAQVPELDVELAVPGMLATDGEVVEEAGRYTFRVARAPDPGLPPRRAALDRAAAAVPWGEAGHGR